MLTLRMEKNRLAQVFTDYVLGDALTPELSRVERFTWLILGMVAMFVVAELSGL